MLAFKALGFPLTRVARVLWGVHHQATAPVFASVQFFQPSFQFPEDGPLISSHHSRNESVKLLHSDISLEKQFPDLTNYTNKLEIIPDYNKGENAMKEDSNWMFLQSTAFWAWESEQIWKDKNL